MLEILRSETLDPIRHGFFTRKGGASSGVYAGLNCGSGSRDQSELVEINRARVAKAMGSDPSALCGVYQVHSADVVTVDAPILGGKPKADALVSNVPGLVLSILTADCQPVLFADRKAGVVGAAHAGWKGVRDGVLEATLDAMEIAGAHRATTTAVIGPCISQRNYEVDPDFMEDFLSADVDYARFFANGHKDLMMFDLPRFSLHRLRTVGVGQAEWVGHCTYADKARFYSYRRSCHSNESDYGRLISTIRL